MAMAAISAPTTGGREVNFNYLRQIAQAADQLGYFGVLAADGTKLRGFLGGGIGGRALDRAAAISRSGAAWLAIAQRGRAHDRDTRPGLERSAADHVVTGGDPSRTRATASF